MLAGVAVSVLAALVQASGFALHAHFNHNDLYHVIQIAAMFAFYKGFRRTLGRAPSMLWRGPASARRGGVVERGVRREARAPVLLRVVHLEHDRLVALHAREIEPAMPGAVLEPVGLADAVRVAPLGDQQVLKLDAARIGEGERVERTDRLVGMARQTWTMAKRRASSARPRRP